MDELNNAVLGRYIERSGDDPRGYRAAYEYGLSRQVFEKLWNHYPNYDWKVKVDARQGMVVIQLPFLMRQTLGWNFAIDKLASDPSMSIVVKGGGELLERWKLRRGRANRGEYLDQRAKHRVIKIGQHVDGGLPVADKARLWGRAA